jgi:RHS repeat-associated protein
MSNQTYHCETSQSAVRGGALQRGATIDFGFDAWWRWDLGWSAVTQAADTDTNWTVEGFNRFFVPYGHAALAETDVTTTPANAAYNYLAQDHLGTGRFVYNQAKAETASFEHLPYGDRYAATGAAPYHEFTGKPWDDDAGLYYFPYRYYAPTIARWTTPDPLGLVDGPNVYGYVAANPIVFLDRLGTDIDIGDVDNACCHVVCICSLAICACSRLDCCGRCEHCDIGPLLIVAWPDRPVQTAILDMITATCEWWDAHLPWRSRPWPRGPA